MRSARHQVNALALVVFGVAFGFVEAAVVYYLRLLISYRFTATLTHYRVLLNLGAIEFVRPAHALLATTRVADVEVTREGATLVMLLALALVAGSTWRQRIGAFLIGFSAWDLSYYLFLRIIDHWPESPMTRDVFFLIPVASIGPVLTPLVLFTVLLVVGLRLYLRPSR